ncbi:hypothetical protein V1283_008285 [Bradyrhizobium sp. AZCC 2262]|uniref:tail fiber domain-containing protein n=1 Tax=Bradyrhizobium sp. AZCC 2262 TaxID=3117022 RepID=UPI002FF3B190
MVLRTIVSIALVVAIAAPLSASAASSSPTTPQQSVALQVQIMDRFADLLRAFQNFLSHQSATTTPQQVAAGGSSSFAGAGRIDTLSNTTIQNPTITGGSISGTSIVGVISNTINSAIATIDNLTSNTITATNASFTTASTTNLFVTGSATSTFAGGASLLRIDTVATSTLAGLVVGSGGLRLTTTVCSSFGNGGKITTDASGNLLCAADQGGAGSTVGGSDTQVQFNDNGSFAGNGSFAFSSSSARLTVSNASTTNISVSNSFTIGALSGLLRATNGSVATSLVNLSADVSGILSPSSGGIGWANVAANTVLLGNGAGALATSTRGNLTETGSSVLTITGGSNALVGSGASIQVAQASASQAGFLSQADWVGFNSRLSTSTLGLLDRGVFFSTTSVAYWDSTQFRWATTSSDAWLATKSTSNLAEGANLYYTPTRVAGAIAATTTDALAEGTSNKYYTDPRVQTYLNGIGKGFFFATSSSDYWKTQGNFFSTTSAAFNLSTYDKGYFFSTTSVAYWDSFQFRWATTSTDAWLATKTTDNLAEGSNQYFTPARVAGVIAGTTTDALAEGSNNKYYTDTRANNFIAGSTTVPKTYTNNTYTATNGFQNITATGATTTSLSTGIASTSNLTISSIQNSMLYTGPGGIVTAATINGPLSFGAGALSITSANSTTNGYLASTDWTSFNSRLSTSSLGLIDKGYFYSTTSADYYKSVNNFFSTSSAAFFSSVGLSFSTTSTDFYKSQNNFHSTSSFAYDLSTYDKGFFFSTTSVAYWDSTQFRWATTSTDAWFATKTTSNLAEGSNLYYQDMRVNSYIAASTSVPKTFASNTFSGLNAFANVTATAGTSTAFFATTASSTNFFSNSAIVGTATLGSLSLGNALTVANGGTGATSLTGLLQGNGSSALTAVGGSAGQFPYFNGANTLGATSSIFLATSGNVGIGTGGPSAKLEVNATAAGSTAGNSSEIARFSTVDANGEYLRILDYRTANGSSHNSLENRLQRRVDASDMGYVGFGSNYLSFAGNGTENMRIDSSGNVGIGTTTPQQPLSVIGDASFGTNGSDRISLGLGLGIGINRNVSTGQIFNSGAYAYQLTHTDSATAANDSLAWQVYAPGGGGVSSNALVINGSGNVGIGTTTPDNLFSIEGSTNGAVFSSLTNSNSGVSAAAEFDIRNGYTAGTGLKLRVLGTGFTTSGTNIQNSAVVLAGTSLTGGLSVGTIASSPLMFWTTNSERMRIDSAGNVGIGNTSPDGKLTVGDGTAATKFDLYGNASGSKQSWVRLWDSSGQQIGMFVGLGNTNVVSINGGGSSYFNGGNVGIGTTTPGTLLHINGSDATSYTAAQNINTTLSIQNESTTNNSFAQLIFKTTDTVGASKTGAAIDGIFTSHTSGAVSAELAFITSNSNTRSEALRITAAGNVGIGTTTPDAKLTVSTNTTGGSTVPSGTNLHVLGTDATANRITLDSYGNLNSFGMQRANGTAASKTASAADDLLGILYGTGYDGTSAYGAGGAQIRFSASQAFTTSNQGTYMTFHTVANNTTTNVERLRIDNAGNVGIGTTTPNSLLTLSGSESSAGVNRAAIRFGDTTASQQWTVNIFGSGSNEGTGKFGINQVGSGSRFLIDTSGNVGIGTTTPQNNLVVDSSGATTQQINGTGANATLKLTKSGALTWEMLSNSASSDRIQIDNGTNGVLMNSGDTLWSSLSDARLKSNVQTLSVLDRLSNFRAVSFNWKTAGMATSTQLGVIAQELYPIFPEAVNKGSDDPNVTPSIMGNDAWSVKYDLLGVLALEGVKEIANLSDAFKATLVAWLGSATNGITTLFAGSGHFSNELCVGSTCVNEDQLRTLLENANVSGSSAPQQNNPPQSDASSSNGGGTSTPPVSDSPPLVPEETPAPSDQSSITTDTDTP